MTHELRNLIKEGREKKGLTPEALARLCHCSPFEIKGFELGLLSLRANTLFAIFQTLEIDAEALHSALGSQALETLSAEANRSKIFKSEG